MRELSHLIHGSYAFYAQKVSIIPLYNRVHIKEAVFVPSGYSGENVYHDPDLPIYYENWRETIANSIREALEIDNWVQLNIGGVRIPLNEWKTYDLFEREAIKISANKVFVEQEKANNRAKADMEQKLEASKEYRSNFDGLPKPSFFQQ